MARQLWLLRHADAEPHGTRADPERRLTERGERQARLAGVALGRAGVSFETVLVSPKVRAQQTAQLAAQEWADSMEHGAQQAALQTYAPLAGGFDASQALDALAGTGADARVLLVGHEPDLSNVVAGLTGARIDLKKGGLAVVRLEGGAAGLRPASRVPRQSQSEGGAAGLRPASRVPRQSQSEGAGGELVILLRPRELALIANLATADV